MKTVTAMIALLLLCSCKSSKPHVTGTLNVLPANYSIRVCKAEHNKEAGRPCSPLVTLYADRDLRVPMTNPFSPDATGNFMFYVAGDGEYDIQIEDVSLREKISEAYSSTVFGGSMKTFTVEYEANKHPRAHKQKPLRESITFLANTQFEAMQLAKDEGRKRYPYPAYTWKIVAVTEVPEAK